MKMFNHWLFYALGSAFFAAFVVIFAKIGVANIPSNVATLIRTVVIAFFLLALISLRGEWINPATLNSRTWIFLVLSGVATGLSWICYFRALQMGSASAVVSIDKLSLVFAVLLAGAFLGEQLGWQQWGGVVLMTCGALLIVLK